MERLKNRVKRVIEGVLDLIFPPKCIFCREILSSDEIDRDRLICKECTEEMEIVGWMAGETRIGPCEQKISGLFSALKYNRGVKNAIHGFKFREREFYGRTLGGIMAEGLVDYARMFDVIVPVPLSKERLNQRGFNQSQVVAEELERSLKIKAENDVLVKKVHTQKQSMLKGRERSDNVSNAFCVKYPERIVNKNVLIIDDVLTTGSTLGECAKILLEAGAMKVYVSVIAVKSSLKDIEKKKENPKT